MQHKRYAKPPIVEAIIDLQVRPIEGATLDDLAKWAASLSGHFPVSSPISSMTLKVPEAGKAPDVSNEYVGVRLATADNSRVLQVQQRGFTFSHLTQYTCWEDFSAEAQSWWKKYIAACPISTISRVATRYINKIVIPESAFDLEDYFLLYPAFPKQVNDMITGVFMQVSQEVATVPNASATINFSSTAADPTTSSANSAFVLDFDIAAEGTWDPSSNDAWDLLNEFRRVKNLYFESSISDKCRSLFE